MIGLTVEPEDGETDVLGKSVGDLQDNVIIGTNDISGELKYVTGYTGYSGDPALQKGNYLALKFATDEEATTTVELLGGTVGHPVELDADMNCVFRITDPLTQKIRVVATTEAGKETKVYNLNSLVLETGE